MYAFLSEVLLTVAALEPGDEMGSLFDLAHDIVSQKAAEKGPQTLYPVENEEQRFSVNSGWLELRVVSYGGEFTWGQLQESVKSGEPMFHHIFGLLSYSCLLSWF